MGNDARQIVLASGNAGKLREIARLLGPLGCRVRAQSEFDIAPAAETGTSFVENALLKARHASRLAGLPAIADDSGLAVAALEGRPGIHSARYAGADASDGDNIARLLEEMAEIPDGRRDALFHCAAVYVGSADDSGPLVAEGRWPGYILAAASGDGGFGYDPVFADAATGKPAARMTAEEKNALSHRGRAFRALCEQLAGVFPR